MRNTPDRPRESVSRRAFIAASAAAGAGAVSGAACAERTNQPQPASRTWAAPAGPIVVASGNGLNAVNEAMRQIRAGTPPTDAVVAGVSLVEADPNDMSVGLGGLPNEEGVVTLDASVMDGPMHKAGAVAAIENILHPSQVALKVLRETDHVLIVGEGAYRFARAQGFEHVNLLTDAAREAWLRWKRNLNPNDDWLNDDQRLDASSGRQANADDPIPFTYGTINCCGLDAKGDLGAVTTTSGLSYKIPGRVGDSPIVGAGMYVDNEVGAAGATGRGESLIQSCGAFQIVNHMANGDEPTDACLKVLQWIADHTKRRDLLNDRGEPNFNAVVYAVRKDGVFGSACMRGRRTFAVHDGTEGRTERCTPLFE